MYIVSRFHRFWLHGSLLTLLVFWLVACGNASSPAGNPGASSSTAGTQNTPTLSAGQVNPKVIHLNSTPAFMLYGSDGNFWDFGPDSEVDRITLNGTITSFNAPNGMLTAATNGPDGNIWFTEGNAALVGKIAPDGTIKTFQLASPEDQAGSITAGPDGNLWFTDTTANGDVIGRITPSGSITTFPLAIRTDGGDIVAGKDGNLWFTEEAFDGTSTYTYKIGRITPNGAITEFPLPPQPHAVQSLTLGQLAAGPDGNLWLLDRDGAHIDRVTLQGAVTQLPMPPSNEASELIAGPDGNVWFLDGDQIGRVTPAGTITEFNVSSALLAASQRHLVASWITAGPGKHIWFFDAAYMIVGDIGYISTGQ